jgi:hypothetical protein
MRLDLTSRRADLFARAVRDHLADLETTLPTLLARDAQASLHMWFASFDGLREQLFPGLKRAYLAWRQGDGGAALQTACGVGLEHFRALGAALDLHAGWAMRPEADRPVAIEALCAGCMARGVPGLSSTACALRRCGCGPASLMGILMRCAGPHPQRRISRKVACPCSIRHRLGGQRGGRRSA